MRFRIEHLLTHDGLTVDGPVLPRVGEYIEVADKWSGTVVSVLHGYTHHPHETIGEPNHIPVVRIR